MTANQQHEVIFDIFERVHLTDKDKDIEIIEETELTPQIKMLMHKDQIQLVGKLLLKIKYVGGETPWIDNIFEHSIPVEIIIPANRVSDAWLLDADIQNFSVEKLGYRSLNVTGVLRVYEKEPIRVESNKVKLPREVAQAIDLCRNEDFSNRDILRLALDERGNTPLRDLLYRFADENFDTLVSALYDGYEVEQTPEDKVREYYQEHRMTKGTDQETTDHAIRKVLDWLNIKIEGVNA